MLKIFLTAVIGYLLGSISSSILLSQKLYKTDVRSYGSGNAGATNVARVFGMKLGILTLAADALKTVVSMLLGLWLAGEVGYAVAGASCLVGHCWPVFFKFRGGKGVSVGAVVALLIDWKVFLALAVVFFTLFFLFRRVSVCSIGVAILLPILSFAFGCSQPRCLLALFSGILVIWQHRGNIKRILHGEENKFVPAKPGERPQDHSSK